VEPIGGYDEVLQCAETIRLDPSEISILSLDALIRIKEHIQRPKDHESLMHLQAIKQMRDMLH
jgi:predicted nucleotidyltransferase